MIAAKLRKREEDGKLLLAGKTIIPIPKDCTVTLHACRRGGLYDGPEGSYVLIATPKIKEPKSDEWIRAFC